METLIIISALILLIVVLHYWQKYIDGIKAKYYNLGQHDVIRDIKSTAFWFNKDAKAFNILMLYSIIFQKYGSVNSDSFRRKINDLGDKKISDLSENEIKDLTI